MATTATILNQYNKYLKMQAYLYNIFIFKPEMFHKDAVKEHFSVFEHTVHANCYSVVCLHCYDIPVSMITEFKM